MRRISSSQIRRVLQMCLSPSELQDMAKVEGPRTLKMTAETQHHHAACWDLQWGPVIGTGTFALQRCSANVRL